MIDWVQVAGYKCLLDAEVTVGSFNVLIGRNDTGKSSFLEMLHELSFWTFGGSRYLSGREQPGRAGPKLMVRAEGITIGREFDGKEWRSGASTWGRGQAPPSDAVPEAVRPSLLSSQPLAIDAPRVAAISQRGLGALQPFIASRGQGTAAHFAALALQDRENFDKAEAVLRQATEGRIRDIVVKEDREGYSLHYRLFDGTVIQGADASQGILVYTCFLAIVHREDPPSVLLIEEPENGVHPLRLKEIVNLLRSLTTRGVQIFLTTHSPDLLNWCKSEEVLVFWRPKPESGTSIHKLPADFNERIAMGDSIGQIWASSGEEGLLDRLGEAKPFVREPAA